MDGQGRSGNFYNGRCGVSTDENGLYYMRQRYYNPEIKRFINQDILTGSIGDSQSLNRYSYVQGNPVSYTDPFGVQFVDTGFTMYDKYVVNKQQFDITDNDTRNELITLGLGAIGVALSVPGMSGNAVKLVISASPRPSSTRATSSSTSP